MTDDTEGMSESGRAVYVIAGLLKEVDDLRSRVKCLEKQVADYRMKEKKGKRKWLND